MGHPRLRDGLPNIEFVFLIGAPVSFAATWCLGFPLFLWLRSRHVLSSLAICAISLFLGALTMLAFIASINGFPSSVTHVLTTSGLGAGLGLSVAIAFCLLAGIPLRKAQSSHHAG